MRVILADDSTLLREGLVRLLLEEGHEVPAAVGDGDALVAAVRDAAAADALPDVVVVDVRMPPTHTDEGLRAALTIRANWPTVGVLVLSQYVEKSYAGELITSAEQRIGYLLKDRVMRVEEFLEALDRVGQGGVALDPEVVRQLLSRTTHTDPLAKLTAREREVLAKMAEGHNNARLAEQLHISPSAVEKHVNSIFDKLALYADGGVNRRVLAVVTYLTT
ncbi:two component transcriptional regulator, LuxR family [Kribbella flavida DSM 17836]|uniref:Two component transcriptional regulator, LuxR family n=1 Tax=Kribbella flavida (strain DSM 17836 / JCM 10339 / NBRC 14399) TaxID=479435 RepID=D2Q509_KRIFD|nr:response regulator transcription factor [Kribbella flavida]ADB34264.1 two component transcriptional regulator, LuxR family [Kribbella flavida DSM 17836]